MTDRFARSSRLFEQAVGLLPGGVSSPVRAFRAVGGSPLFFDHGEGCRVTDVDGNEFIDFVCSWGPLILGHAHPEIVDAVTRTAAKGLTFGAPHESESELARRVIASYPGVEQVRFTSSGTEATMSAIRLARGTTGRDRLLKFSGCYHGHSDGLLVAAGSGAITFGQPSSAGVPAAVAALTSVLPLDDEAALRAFMDEHGHEVAAVILEPIPANNGLLLQRREWLKALRELTAEHGAMLIFDEVISGFRVGMGGAAAHYDIQPDLVTFGKIIGGGMPVGAFAGSAEAFAQLAPNGGVYQAGTLSGNPVAMTAGITTLDILQRDDVHASLEKKGHAFEAALRPTLEPLPVSMVRVGSLFWFAFGEGEAPRTAECIAPNASEVYSRFFRACLDEGVYLAPSAYEVGFLSHAHDDETLAQAAERIARALQRTF